MLLFLFTLACGDEKSDTAEAQDTAIEETEVEDTAEQ